MTLRRRITLVVAVAVSIAIASTVLASYVVVRSEVYGQIDTQLRRQAAALTRILESAPPTTELAPRFPLDTNRLPRLAPGQGGPIGYVQLVERSGGVQPRLSVGSGDLRLPVSAADRAIARGERGSLLRTTSLGGDPVRVLTVPAGKFGAVQLGTPLSSAETVMRQLTLLLLAIGIGGLALAIVLSRAVTRRVTEPLGELADAAAHVAETDDLALRIDTDRDDELGQLARRFNSMLDRLQLSREELAGSVAAQRQLVADASHELRTPITSLRTDLEVLLEGGDLDPAVRADILTALVVQTEELGDLVVDVIDLARGDVDLREPEPVRLDEIVENAVRRAARHYPAVRFELQTEPRIVVGAADRLARASANLLDNAAKYSADGADPSVTVVVDASGLAVRDHGPGIPPNEIEHLFDRFYRGEDSRERAGSGLGLAIVRQVAELHGGTATVENAEGGGALFRLRLPADVAD